MVSTLETLLTQAVLANGIDRQAALVAIRNYINTTSQPRVKSELASITSIRLLVQLQGAGIPAYLSDTYFTVWGSLQKYRGV